MHHGSLMGLGGGEGVWVCCVVSVSAECEINGHAVCVPDVRSCNTFILSIAVASIYEKIADPQTHKVSLLLSVL